MKIIDYIEDQLPGYALSYLVNGDDSGIDPEDKENADGWIKGCEATLLAKYPDATIELITRDDDEGGFVHSPAFGLACNAIDCVVVAMVDNEDPHEEMSLPWEKDEEESEA